VETALQGALSMLPHNDRDSITRRYSLSSEFRAAAVAPARRIGWFVWGHPDTKTAITRVLEGCQTYANEPCMLVSIGSVIVPRDASGSWHVAPQPRVAYRGEFDPDQVPVSPATRKNTVISGYKAIEGPKALAYHPWGRVYLGTGSDLSAAQASALKSCNEDPGRKGADGPCYLYAVDNQVVLADRRIAPLP
jgi:hypothetical protein